MYNEDNFTPETYTEPQPEPQAVPQPESPPQVVFVQQEASYVPPQKKKKSRVSAKFIAAALICSLIGSIFGATSSFILLGSLYRNVKTSGASGSGTAILEGERPDTTIDIHKIDTSKVMTPAEVYAANVNSTVGITTSITTNFWGYQTTSAASGSGFIISKDGYILTNHHVIEGSSAITVSFYDGTSKEASLIGYDANNDIAVLKVDAKDLTPVVLGDSANTNVGDTVVAIGNPLGELTFSLTAGAVSALERDVTTSSGVTMELIQTDCAINSGNSGGALFNLYGEVIGITNAKYSTSSNSEASIDNIGFAIPINNVRTIVESLIQNGYIAKPYIGVSVTDVSEDMQSYGLPMGAAVKGVTEESPAAKAGLQVNDIITHVDGKEVEGSSALVKIVSACKKDQVLKLTVYRQGQTLELELTVGEQIQQGVQAPQQQEQQEQPSVEGFGNFPFFNFGY